MASYRKIYRYTNAKAQISSQKHSKRNPRLAKIIADSDYRGMHLSDTLKATLWRKLEVALRLDERP